MESASFPTKEQGKRIESLRKRTLLSRRAFGLKHGIPKGSLQNWESGRYPKLSKFAVEVLLKAFAAENIACTKEYLLYGTEIPKPTHQTSNKDENRSSDHAQIDSELVKQAKLNAETKQLNEELLLAVTAGRSEKVKKILKAGQVGAEFKHFTSEEGNSFLHEAAKTGHLNIVMILVEHGCKVNSKNKLQQTALHLAVKHGYEEIINYLILNGAGVNTADSEGNTPLSWACKMDQATIAHQLIKLGANISAKNQNEDLPMHLAAGSGSLDLVKLLIENGSKLTEKNKSNETPLMCAVRCGHVEVVKYLELC